jgi:hypothetical protein
MKKKANKPKEPSRGLASGQVWKTEELRIHILTFGKRLVHYTMDKSRTPRGMKPRITAISTLEGYLKEKKARLVKRGAASARG